MKRIHSFMAAAFTMIAAASCVQELGNDGQLQEGAVVYKAVAEGADTKAVLGTNEAGRTQSMWEDGDKIYIQTGNWNFYTFTTSLSEPSPVADFTYTGTDDFEIPAGNAVIATHPYINLINLEERYVSFDIPVSQKAGQDVESYDQAAVTVVAYSKNRTLNFKNTSALLKCKVGLSDVAKIRFYGLNDEAVAGSAIAVMKENGEIDNIGVLGGNKCSVELSDASGGALRSSWNYYISIIPNTFASGFGIELLNAEGEVVFTKQYDKSITIERNTILDLGTLGESSDIEPSDGDYIDEYGINHGPGVEIDGVVWAPVNCGYHAEDFKYGKLYQWGRKYGQGYNGTLRDIDGNTIGTVSDMLLPEFEEIIVSAEVANQEGNANIFYKGIEQNNWDYLDSVYDGLWNAGTEYDPVKSEYDPCPSGWRVPTYAELISLTQNHSDCVVVDDGKIGYWFSGLSSYTSEVSQIFLFNAGLRSTAGHCEDRGWAGRYRASNSTVSCLCFNNNGIVDVWKDGDSRANGYSVRCVKDDSSYEPGNGGSQSGDIEDMPEIELF